MPEPQQPEEPRTDTPDRERRREVISLATLVVAIFAALVGTATLYLRVMSAQYFSGANVIDSFIRLEEKKVAVFQGELENVSSFHAHGLTLKGKFNTGIIDYKFETSDFIESQRVDDPPGSGCFEISLKRLSKKSKFLFYFVVDKKCQVVEEVFASWGNDRSLKLKLQQADKRIQKAFELGSDVSRLPRKKWLERNAKNL